MLDIQPQKHWRQLIRSSNKAAVRSPRTDLLSLTSTAPCDLHSHVAPHVTRKPRLVEGEVLWHHRDGQVRSPVGHRTGPLMEPQKGLICCRATCLNLLYRWHAGWNMRGLWRILSYILPSACLSAHRCVWERCRWWAELRGGLLCCPPEVKHRLCERTRPRTECRWPESPAAERHSPA